MTGDPIDEATILTRAVTSSTWVVVRGIVVRAFGLTANLILARLLTPADFGLAALGFSVIGFATFLADGGLGAGLIRRHESPTIAELRAVLGFQLLITASVSAVALVIGALVGRQGLIVAVMVASVCFLAFQAPGAISLERELLYGRRVIVEIAETLAFSAFAIIAVLLGAGVWGIAGGMVFRGVVGATLMSIIAPQRVLRPTLHVSELRGVLAFGLKFQGIGLLNLTRDQGINLSLLLLGGVNVLGLWALAFRVLQIPFVLFESLWRVSFPAIARLQSAGYDVARGLRRIVNLVSLVAGTVIVGLAAASHDLIAVAFGDQWDNAGVVVLPVCLGLLFTGPLSVGVAGYLYARGHANVILWSSIAHTVAWLGVVLCFYPVIGLLAVGLGSMASGFADAAVMTEALRRREGIATLHLVLGPFLWGACVSACGFAVGRTWDGGWLEVVALGSSGAVTYALGMAVIRPSAYGDAAQVLNRLRA